MCPVCRGYIIRRTPSRLSVVVMVGIYHQVFHQSIVLDHFASISMILLLECIPLTHFSGFSIGFWSVDGAFPPPSPIVGLKILVVGD